MLSFDSLCPLLQVFDMPTSIRFYRDMLGFCVAETSPQRSPDDSDWAWLRHGQCNLMLNTAFEAHQRPAAISQARRASHSDIALYLACNDIDGAYRLLTSSGIDVPKPVVAPYGMRQLSFADPDGYGICLQWPAA